MEMLVTDTAGFAVLTVATSLHRRAVDLNAACNGMAAEPAASRYGAMPLAADQCRFRERLVVWMRGFLNSDVPFDVQSLLPAAADGRL